MHPVSKIEVAIFLTTLNGESFLEEQLLSIRQQSVKNWQLYVHDDGSKDKTLCILKNSGIDYVLISNEGEPIGTFAGYRKLSHLLQEEKIIIFCDQDDIWELNHLHEHLETHSNLLDFNLVISDGLLIDSKNTIVGSTPKPRTQIYELMLSNNVQGCRISVKTGFWLEFLKQNYSSKRFADEQILLFASLKESIFHLPKITMRYRLHENNQVGVAKRSFIKIVRTLPVKFEDSLTLIKDHKLLESSDIEIRLGGTKVSSTRFRTVYSKYKMMELIFRGNTNFQTKLMLNILRFIYLIKEFIAR